MTTFISVNSTLYHADALATLSTILDGTINLIFADPPYNIGKDFNGRKDKCESDEAYLEWHQLGQISGALYEVDTSTLTPPAPTLSRFPALHS